MLNVFRWRLKECVEIWKQAPRMVVWAGLLAYVNAIRGCFWVLLDIENKKILDDTNSVPVHYTSTYAVYDGPNGDPPSPAYDMMIISRNWFIPGYNIIRIM